MQMAAQYCCSKPLLDFKLILDCANGELGTLLLVDNGKETDELDPELTSTPWIAVNGVHNDTIQSQAITDLPG